MLKFLKKKPATEPAPATQEAPVHDEQRGDAATPPPLARPATRPAMTTPPAAPHAPPGPPADALPDHESVPARRSWRERLSGNGFARGLASLFTRNPVLDDAFLDELETCLITADMGVTGATELIEKLRKRVARREFADAGALLAALRAELVARLEPVQQPLVTAGHTPFVILMVGVNGVGKTTTIGKLAWRLRNEGRGVLLAAGDTFRAAAVEQLQSWGARHAVPVIAQGSGADAASVIFDALQTARARGIDVMIADTAGRLHTQTGLMDELAKIRRVLGKLDPQAPHEVLLVIDGTTGQNAIHQVRQFREAVGVTGLVVTKLDGTAKGGVVFALAREFGLPIRFVGLGETAGDLREFDAAAFVDGLLPTAPAGHA
ncbi:signal recognition particle-docking protein FtsY [Dokdonella sp.]|uniref:signal recognition particle-docking protein FtsY n=1 Tax=Dokdonella sp. TaxID=2291710 RepID=UPI0031C290E4|nr:signal recognition particle-docking protein FtsY [Dokdonella sp.]